MAWALRSTVDKWDLMKVKNFCKEKDIVNRITWQPTDWKKIVINPTSDRGLISKIYKEFKNLDSRKTNNQLHMGYRAKQRILNWGYFFFFLRHFL
jgi:hypothetical protein